MVRQLVIKNDDTETGLKRCDTCFWEYPATKEYFGRSTGYKSLRETCLKCYREKLRARPKRLTKICEYCGGEFDTNTSAQKFCGETCRVSARDKDRFMILERDRFRCIYCGHSSIEDGTELHIDHVIPEIRGGKTIAENLVTSCGPCNEAKHDNVIRDTNRIIAEIARRNLESNINGAQSINLASG